MGCCKQLLPLGDQPVIVHCLSSLISAGITDLVIVLGIEHEQLAQAVREFTATIVYNLEPESDMAASLSTGRRALSIAATGVIVCLADHPLVSPETYRSLLQHHRKEPQKIIIPVYQGSRGHPVLFPRNLLEDLDSHPTLRDLVRFDPSRVLLLETTDRGVVLDMDTPEDYRDMVLAFHASLIRVPG
jgi:molybdenum cofactor cytidylyltransferase